jgi:hypothetical protein
MYFVILPQTRVFRCKSLVVGKAKKKRENLENLLIADS